MYRMTLSLLKRLERILILTGAGLSAESGLSTFRGEGGQWKQIAVEEVATPDAYSTSPFMVQDFYNMRRRAGLAAKPNAAHHALALLQQNFDGHVSVVTQNVDDLHERAGVTDVLHMHGELFKARCTTTGIVIPWRGDIRHGEDRCPCCTAVGTLRPDIVWFSEMPMHMETIEDLLKQADLFAAIGTSGHVYPAAGFAQTAHLYGARTLELNLEAGENCHLFDASIYGRATVVVPKWVNDVLERTLEV